MFERQVLFGEQEGRFEKLVRGVSIQNDVSKAEALPSSARPWRQCFEVTITDGSFL